MSLQQRSAAEWLADPGRYDTLIDARSPAEFAEDHLPGALNWPVLDDEERARVGTLYAESPLEARKLGAVLVSRNIANHLEAHASLITRDWRPLVYCWRGGQRSGSLALVISQIGPRTTQLAGGYKGFRAVVRDELAALPTALHFTVLCGRTGSGKTRLLQTLAAQGDQVLDLEALAQHRGSILGAVPGQPQPTQKHFETLVWQALHRFSPERPVYVESESARIGRLRVPEPLLLRMRDHGRSVVVHMDDAPRIALLLQDYAALTVEVEHFCGLLGHLVALQGRETVATWQAQARAGQWGPLLADLMARHYDPLYQRSTQRHYAALAQAPHITLHDGSAEALEQAARALTALPPAR
ncbi:MAG: tRNA 2-selenouridine(34) synthase MnmH [Rubrivivax sp.]|jgi:tRNA 2-selenouridine synthase